MKDKYRTNDEITQESFKGQTGSSGHQEIRKYPETGECPKLSYEVGKKSETKTISL